MNYLSQETSPNSLTETWGVFFRQSPCIPLLVLGAGIPSNDLRIPGSRQSKLVPLMVETSNRDPTGIQHPLWQTNIAMEYPHFE